MSGTTQAIVRVKVDKPLKDAVWNLTYGSNVPFEHALPDGVQTDYVPCGRQGPSITAKRVGVHPIPAQDRG